MTEQFKTIADMTKQPKYNLGETVTMKSANLYGEKVGTITEVDRIYREVDRFGRVEPHGLATMEHTISSICIPYTFDGETLEVKYEDGRTRKSVFTGYTYTIKSAKMLSMYSESGITRNGPKPVQIGDFFMVENIDGNNGSFENVANGGPEVYVTDKQGNVQFKDNRHEAELWMAERMGTVPICCPTCKGKKTVEVSFSVYGSDKPAEKSVQDCVTCHGTGRVTPQYAKAFNKVWAKENWCSCKKSSGADHTRKGGQDYYNCNDCGKTVQIG